MIELNGIANIKIILQTAKESKSISDELYKSLYEQADFLERYSIQIAEEVNRLDTEIKATNPTLPTLNIPPWYEIRENPLKFPNVKERNAS